tara:strand:- start:125 stop:733 length:609 start_codon:yes stop_codon:yes gene_type:complete
MSTVMTIGKRVDPKMKFDRKDAKRMTSFTVYALLENIDDLAKATYLDNREFFYVSLDKRYDDVIEMMVVDVSGSQFELVTRKLKADKVNFIDTTCLINPETFDALKSFSDLGFKHKYLQFPIPGTEEVWEVSVFLDNNGHDHPWVRCELFTDDVSKVTSLPFPIQKFIVEGDPQNTKEDVNIIRELWLKGYSRTDTSDVIKT